ncbi:MAG: alpha/beta hydrolase [Pirellulaceae bacterium]|nr:alpha/beta hydrolase [Pirellulaceae bacterium]
MQILRLIWTSLLLWPVLCVSLPCPAAEIIRLWPSKPPGKKLAVGAEQDITNEQSRLVAGQPLIRLTNVTTPEVHVFHPEEQHRNGASVIVCPGGGFRILAWDLEGTEVAEWLNSLGVTAIVLKYRTPTQELDPAWLLPVQDAQRAVSLVRHHAAKWQLDPNKVGILGFSAGGKTAGNVAMTDHRYYDALDSIDKHSCLPNFSVLIYPAWLAQEDQIALREDLQVSKNSPPMFLVHAFDDGVPLANCLAVLQAYKSADVPSELHVYDAGGHGYGLRPRTEYPVTTWPQRCAEWLERNRWIDEK